ncbi:MAG: hypothetical protein K6U89_05075 [Chloroflexi bacterium]|nr:hypothetical protein [Chloroflexota bacterium]
MRRRWQWQLIGNAAAHGCLTTFVLTHGLFLHLIPLLSPILLISAPIVGGIRARQRARLGPASALLVALAIALANAFPYLLLVPLVVFHRHIFADAATADRAIAILCWAVGGFTLYSFCGALAGILFRHSRPPRPGVTPELVWTRPLQVTPTALCPPDWRREATLTAWQRARRYTVEEPIAPISLN